MEQKVYVEVKTKMCFHCKKVGFIIMDQQDWINGIKDYQIGAFVQDAFPKLNDGQREQIISGTHPECWEILFPENAAIVAAWEKNTKRVGD